MNTIYLLVMIISFQHGMTSLQKTFPSYDACQTVKQDIDNQVENNNGQIVSEKCYEIQPEDNN